MRTKGKSVLVDESCLGQSCFSLHNQEYDRVCCYKGLGWGFSLWGICPPKALRQDLLLHILCHPRTHRQSPFPWWPSWSFSSCEIPNEEGRQVAYHRKKCTCYHCIISSWFPRQGWTLFIINIKSIWWCACLHHHSSQDPSIWRCYMWLGPLFTVRWIAYE